MNHLLALLSSGGQFSEAMLCQAMGLNREALNEALAQLRADGWQLDGTADTGYQLHAGDRIEPSLWETQLTTHVLGRGINHFAPLLSSTNTVLRQMASDGAPTGSTCLCEAQSAGKGRLGRVWHAPEGQGIWLSVLLRPSLSPQDAPLITFAAALAMAKAIRQSCGVDAQIKWPNDLVVAGKKICGILLEISATSEKINHIVVGTGLNVRRGAYPPELAERAAALEDFVAPPLRRDVLRHYLQALEETVTLLETQGFDGLYPEYRRRCCTLGRSVHVTGAATELTGLAEEMDETGALLVRTDDGVLHRVLSGDVSVRGVMGYV